MMLKSRLTSFFIFSSIVPVLVCTLLGNFQLINGFTVLQQVPLTRVSVSVRVRLHHHVHLWHSKSRMVLYSGNNDNNNDESNAKAASSSSSPPPSSPLPSRSRRPDSSNYLDILTSNTPLLDVRAPVEFLKGSFPNAHNIPLLNDEHRELVGTCYNEMGQDAAIALGNELVNGRVKAEIIQSWKDHIHTNNKNNGNTSNGYLYCFRGGLRSHIAQQWIHEETGIHYPLIIGGYKAMRSSLLHNLELALKSLPIVLIGGRTCSGKTIALKKLSRYIDLEGLANHRGSAFGGIAKGGQPAQIDFENSIIIEFCKLNENQDRTGTRQEQEQEQGRGESSKLTTTFPVFMEDEGHRIGCRTLPIPMHRPMVHDFPLVILETPLEERVDICIEEYIKHPFLAFVEEEVQCNVNTNDKCSKQETEARARIRIRSNFMDAVGRIKKGLQKRLGDCNRGNKIIDELENAFDLFEEIRSSSNSNDADADVSNHLSGFRKPIQSLLEDYYDPMYDYQMSQRKGEVLFHGNMQELVKWAEDYTGNGTK